MEVHLVPQTDAVYKCSWVDSFLFILSLCESLAIGISMVKDIDAQAAVFIATTTTNWIMQKKI